MWKRPHVVFILAAAVLGIALLLLTPPTAGVDESSHFLRAYEVSEFHWIPERDVAHMGRSDVPKRLVADLQRASFELRPGGDHTAFLDHLRDRAPTGERALATVGAISGYGPLGYLPAALAIGLGRLVGMSTLALLYGARLLNLCAYIAVVAFAVRRAPTLPWLFASIGLLPVGLFAAATVTTDAPTYALVMLVVAQALRGSSDEWGSWGSADTAIAVAAAIALGLVKPPYALFALLLLPTAWRRGGRDRVLLAAAAVGSLVMMGGWTQWMHGPLSTQSLFTPVVTADPFHPYTHVDSTQQLVHHVVGDPIGFAQVLVRTTGRYGTDWLRDVHAQLSIPHLPNGVAALAWVALALGMLSAPAIALRRQDRALLGVVAAAVAVATLVGAYSSWNALASPYVRAYQGRYLYPVLLPFAIALTPRNKLRWAGCASFGTACAATGWYVLVVNRVFY
jgi:uncharacterized membrane protein